MREKTVLAADALRPDGGAVELSPRSPHVADVPRGSSVHVIGTLGSGVYEQYVPV